MDYLRDIWKTTLAQLEVKLDNPSHYKTWFQETSLISIDNTKAKIGTKNTYASEWLRGKHYSLIQKTLTYVYGKKVRLEFIIDKTLVNIPTEKINIQKNNEVLPMLSMKDGQDMSFKNAIERSSLNPNYTFSNFVVGESNALPHAAALGVASDPGKVYNPFFLYGGTGLGKTHLAQAIGRSILDKNPSKKIMYLSSETFMNELISAIQNGKNIEFRRKYRTCDALIIDDIQLIAKRTKTQEEFFNTFNILYNTNRQIILISDVSPDKLKDIDARLKSRFQGGMVSEIYKPDLETRMAIVNKKCISMGIDLPQEFIDLIASEIKENIRELEGAIQKISLYYSIGNKKLTIEEVRKLLGKDHMTKREQIKVPQILKRVAKEFDIEIKDLKGPKRNANIAFARQVCMFILRNEFKYKLEETASILNRKDHTTVIHAVDKIESNMMINNTFKKQIEYIIEDLNNI